MILVIAGNYQQFNHWRRENNISPQDARYVSRPENLRGYEKPSLVKVGTWYENEASNAVVELESAGYFGAVKEV